MFYPDCLTLSGSPAARTRVLRELAAREVGSDDAVKLLEDSAGFAPAEVSRALRERGDRPAVAIVSRIAAMVQSWPYLLDDSGRLDTVCSLATTAKRGGDCEDKAKAVVVLCQTAGIPADFLWMVQSGIYDHVTALVKLPPVGWCYVETTVRAYVGENPYRAAARLDGRARLGLEVG